jgi:hypothetical protein
MSAGVEGAMEAYLCAIANVQIGSHDGRVEDHEHAAT